MPKYLTIKYLSRHRKTLYLFSGGLILLLLSSFFIFWAKHSTGYFAQLANDANKYSSEQIRTLGADPTKSKLIKDCYETYAGYPPGLKSPSKEHPLNCGAKRTIDITIPDTNTLKFLIAKLDNLAHDEGFSGHSGTLTGTSYTEDFYYSKGHCQTHITYPINFAKNVLEYHLVCDDHTVNVPFGYKGTPDNSQNVAVVDTDPQVSLDNISAKFKAYYQAQAAALGAKYSPADIAQDCMYVGKSTFQPHSKTYKCELLVKKDIASTSDVSGGKAALTRLYEVVKNQGLTNGLALDDDGIHLEGFSASGPDCRIEVVYDYGGNSPVMDYNLGCYPNNTSDVPSDFKIVNQLP